MTVDYQQIANDNIANQIHGFVIDYGKFILNIYSKSNLRMEIFINITRQNYKHSGKKKQMRKIEKK